MFSKEFIVAVSRKSIIRGHLQQLNIGVPLSILHCDLQLKNHESNMVQELKPGTLHSVGNSILEPMNNGKIENFSTK